jgi:hypothetical protein
MASPIFDPVTGQLIDPVTGQPVGTSGVNQPAPQAPPQAPATAPQGQSTSTAQGNSYGMSQSGRGIDQNTAAQLDQQAAQLPMEQPSGTIADQAATETKNATNAANQLTDAQRREASIQAAQLEAQQSAFKARAALEGDLIRAESLAAEHAETQATGARARYMQQITALSQMQLDPTLNFSKGQSLGNAASLFAQGFLGAAGIKIDAQGAIDRWTDRYVDAQMEKFRRGTQLAESDRMVWDMIRTEAMDESDARTRLKGMLLAQADTAMQAESAKYGSQMALAVGDEARAKIQANLANTLAEIQRNARDTAMKQNEMVFNQWAERKRLSISSWSTSIQAAANKREQEKWDAQKGQNPNAPGPGDLLYDTSESGGGKAAGQYSPNMSKEDRVKAQAAYNGVIAMNAHVKELMELAGNQSIYGGPGGDIVNSDAAAKIEALRLKIRADYSLMKSGKATNAEEIKAFDKIIPGNYLLTNGNRQQVLAEFYKNNLEEVNTQLRGNVLGTDGNWLQAPDLNLAPGETAFGNIAANPQPPTTTDQQKLTAQATSDNPGYDGDTRAEGTPLEDKWVGFSIGRNVNPNGYKWTPSMVKLANQAEHGDDSSRSELEKIATGAVPSGPVRQAFAQFLLENLSKGPSGLITDTPPAAGNPLGDATNQARSQLNLE